MSNQKETIKCKIKIVGTTGRYETDGELEREADNFQIRYQLSGDECLLDYSFGTLTHTRKGQVNLELSFKEGEHTLCYLGEGESRGQFKVFSEIVKVKSHANGAKVKLKYISDGETVELSFLAFQRI